jgi:methylmalonyl-CoA/ethylmalonyl-CoA epimerase
MTEPTKSPLGSISQIANRVHDIDRAAAFYGEVLGLEELFRAPCMAFFHCGGQRLMLTLPSAPRFDHPASILYFGVEGIDAAYAALAARGVAFEDEPHKVAEMPDHDLWMAFFRDSEDNLMALSGKEPKAGR